MKVITCVDNDGGLFFNERRQSQDRGFISNLLQLCKGRTLYISDYSAPLFPKEKHIKVVEDPLKTAKKRQFCFVEGQYLKPYEDKIEALILYHWNRDYPADRYLDLDLTQWTLVETTTFAGTSHDHIRREVYVHEVN